jgi:hypothetical protein
MDLRRRDPVNVTTPESRVRPVFSIFTVVRLEQAPPDGWVCQPAQRHRIHRMPRSQHDPSPAERDERVKLDLPAETDGEDADWENEGGATESGPQEAGSV